MTRFTSALAGLALVAAFGASGAMAATATKTAKVRSPESIACSQQADAKALHGKERKAFRSTCLSQARAAAGKAASSAPPKSPAAAPADKRS